ncbi:hypothetical protein BDBG_17525 [Blastomyces gilchristii SLH14081]|uniref:Cytochrome P450 n=1 Tax=Blastomyces gilchristii (strain SLH14081) TaxID=559298 RepID=A0A179UTM9_BLAGS|nr:uncharacterized protein BDBG_17525 [Blastomyces gilchristii SLH14081]OAT11446.1 hypothetical protein BDBG_17525 [Blastomyces gilchristii SLH14081]
MIASLTNSMGTAFWMVYHVFSDPIVLEECRAEAEKLVQLDDNGVQTIDLAKIRSSCPVLFSTWAGDSVIYAHWRRGEGVSPDEKRKTPFTFRPFGGGTVLCPGRHFVTAGVLSFVILLLLRFDLKPAIKDGRWLELRKKMSMTAAMPVPKDEMPVKLAPRNTQKGPVNISTIGGKLFY